MTNKGEGCCFGPALNSPEHPDFFRWLKEHPWTEEYKNYSQKYPELFPEAQKECGAVTGVLCFLSNQYGCRGFSRSDNDEDNSCYYSRRLYPANIYECSNRYLIRIALDNAIEKLSNNEALLTKEICNQLFNMK